MQVRLSKLEFKVGADMALECRHAPGWNTDEFVQDEHTPIKLKQSDTPAQTRNLITDTNFKSITQQSNLKKDKSKKPERSTDYYRVIHKPYETYQRKPHLSASHGSFE